jgi:hypothetical protein
MFFQISYSLRFSSAIPGGFGCVKLDGRMSAIQKAAAIQKFNTNPDVNVFLISLKAGGVALNLTIANYCFLMDPCKLLLLLPLPLPFPLPLSFTTPSFPSVNLSS